MRAMMRADLGYWAAHQAAFECQRALCEKGISLSVTVDIDEIRESVERIGKPYLTPWLDPKLNDFTPANYFWLIASRNENPVIVGGGRLDDVGQNAGGHMSRAFARGYGPDAVLSVNAELSRHLAGRLCYLGDLFSKSGAGLSRVHRRNYLGVANYIASQHFKADHTYSFMRATDVLRGSADLNGLDRRLYDPVRWGAVPDGRDESEIIVYRKAKDDPSYFDRLKRELVPRELESIAARDDLQQEVQA